MLTSSVRNLPCFVNSTTYTWFCQTDLTDNCLLHIRITVLRSIPKRRYRGNRLTIPKLVALRVKGRGHRLLQPQAQTPACLNHRSVRWCCAFCQVKVKRLHVIAIPRESAFPQINDCTASRTDAHDCGALGIARTGKCRILDLIVRSRLQGPHMQQRQSLSGVLRLRDRGVPHPSSLARHTKIHQVRSSHRLNSLRTTLLVVLRGYEAESGCDLLRRTWITHGMSSLCVHDSTTAAIVMIGSYTD